MHIEVTEVLSLEQHQDLTFQELADLSRLSEAELRELWQSGVIAASEAEAAEVKFSATCLVAARTACRLRDDLELDMQAIVLVLELLDRIHALESDARLRRA